jgi:uncharacterized protein (DUF362 family)
MQKYRLTRRSFIGGTMGLLAGSPAILNGSTETDKTEVTFSPLRKSLPNPFVENGKPVVLIVHGTEFAAMLAKGMELLGGFARFGNDKSVVVKPNFIMNNKSRYPITTDPQSVLTTVEYLQKEGFTDICVADSRNTEDGEPGGMFKYGGINERAKIAGFQTDAMRTGPVVQVKKDDWRIMPRVGIYKRIYDSQLIINMPTVKEHLMTGFTASLKNVMGTIDEWTCMHMHLWGDENKAAAEGKTKEEFEQRLCYTIAEAADAIRPELTVIDARTILGKSHLHIMSDNQRTANRLIISGDPLAADVVTAGVFKELYEPINLKCTPETFARAAGLKIGVADIDEMAIKEVTV